MNHKAEALFVPLQIAVLTVSDTRTLETDTSGQLFVDRLQAAGHQLPRASCSRTISTRSAPRSPAGLPTTACRWC